MADRSTQLCLDMARYAFKLRIKADAIEEYEREHTRVWPELLAKLKEVGISEYSIFRRGQELFLFLQRREFRQGLGRVGSGSRESTMAGIHGQAVRAGAG